MFCLGEENRTLRYARNFSVFFAQDFYYGNFEDFCIGYPHKVDLTEQVFFVSGVWEDTECEMMGESSTLLNPLFHERGEC